MQIKILLADDSPEKITYIKEALDKNIIYDSLDITKSYKSTMMAIKDNTYDLLILDMSMPTFESRDDKTMLTPRPLAGKDILSKLHYRKVKLPVIVLTQFDVFGRLVDAIGLSDLTEDLSKSFPNNFKGCVFYDPQSSKWVNELVSIINGIEFSE
ncbi:MULTISPECIES: response regulator [Serratia]|uniref:response regulator n=1 Tax=Serratia TaxID=613 RepID=UPI00074561BA|nr:MULTISPECIES: response regulator [Serratia]CVH23266.1 Response regulator receiver domain [Serratia marcescens]